MPGWERLHESVPGWTYDGHCTWCGSANVREKGSFDACNECGERIVPPDDEEVDALRALTYRDYLATDHWQTLRQRVLARAGFRCHGCGTAKNLHVHHVTYDRLGYEHHSDLAVLCKTCHESAHQSDLGR